MQPSDITLPQIQNANEGSGKIKTKAREPKRELRLARTGGELKLRDFLLSENENRELTSQIRRHEEMMSFGVESHGL